MSGLHVFETTHKQGSTLRYHRHGVAYITLVVAGRYTEVHSLLPAAYSSGGVVLHGVQEEHSDYFTGDAICLNIEIGDDSFLEVMDVETSNDRAVRSAADALIATYYRHGEVEHAARNLQSALRSAAQKRMPERPDWLQLALAAFDWTSGEPISAAAALAGVHPAHFSRAFAKCVGMTPAVYRQSARLKLASRMVLASEQSLAAIAASSGFADQSHLTRTFTESLGMSPSRFRRAFES